MIFILLTYTFLFSFPDSTDSDTLFAEANGIIMVPCSKTSEKVASVKWYINDQLLISHDLNPKPNAVTADKAGVSVGEDYSLSLTDLSLNDTGNYTCRLVSTTGYSISNVTKEVVIQGESVFLLVFHTICHCHQRKDRRL